MQRRDQYLKRRKPLQKKNRNNKASKGWDGALSISNTEQRIPRQVGLILPDRYRTNLRFWKQVSLNFVANNAVSIRFRPSSAFDVDPVVASTAMSGFVELSALYNSYRVLSSKIRTEAVTTSAANPVNIYVAPVNFDPGATPSAANILALREQPYAKSRLIGLSGSPSIKINSTMSTEKIYGSKMALFDDNFAAPITASPNNNWYWQIGAYSFVLDPSLTWVTITIEVDVEFYDRNFLQN
jgi:hypothetical protein